MIFVIVVIAFVLTHEERKSLSKFKSIRKKKKKKKKKKTKTFSIWKNKISKYKPVGRFSAGKKKKEKVRHKIKERKIFFFFFFFYKIFPINSNLLKFETASSLFLSVGTVRPERSTKQPEKEGNGGEIFLVSFVSRHATIAKNMKKIIINKNKQRVTECVLFPFTSSPICPFFFPMWWTSFLTRWLHTLPIPLLEE